MAQAEQATQIAEYDEFRAQMAEIIDRCNFVPDPDTKEGYEASRTIALAVRKSIGAIEKKRKQIKADVIERGRLIDAEAKLIMEPLEEACKPHQDAYKAVDKRKKEEKQRRLEEQQARVDAIASIPTLMIDSDSEGIAMALEDLRNNECEGFNEHTEAALLARKDSIGTLERMHREKLAAEIAKQQLEELQAQQAREEAASLERERQAQIEREAAEAEVRRQQEEAAAAAAAQQKIIDDLQAEKAAREAEEQRRLEEEERKAQEAKAAKEAEELAAKEAEEAAARQKADEEELEVRRVADLNHRQSVREAVITALLQCADISVAEAADVFDAIDDGSLPNVHIEY